MTATLRFWWRQIKQHRVAIGVVVIVLVVVIALIIAGYWFDWTGFNGYDKVTITHTIIGANAGTVTRTEEYQQGKALWDWLQLLIVPLVLAVAALLFNFATARTEQKIAAQRYQQDQHIALDKQREDLLQTYLDRMSELLLKEKLRSSTIDDEVRNVARVRTITALFQLDARRIGYVFAFLREAGLMSNKTDNNIVSLSLADLRNINFSRAELWQANLSKVDLRGANLGGGSLVEANLSRADLRAANLCRANLREVNLSGADLSSCTGYLDHPFKNKHVQTEKDRHSLLANTGGSV
jgi:Pentapeptide repeats (8 copies)